MSAFKYFVYCATITEHQRVKIFIIIATACVCWTASVSLHRY